MGLNDLFIGIFLIVITLVIVIFVTIIIAPTFMESKRDELVTKLSLFSSDRVRAGGISSSRVRRNRGSSSWGSLASRSILGASAARSLAVAVGADNMRKLASLGSALPFLRKVGAFTNMLLVAVEALFAVAEHREVAADTLTLAYAHVGEGAVGAVTPTVISKVHAERRAFWSRIVRESTSFRCVGTVALQEVPADGDLGGIVLIHASQATIASTCCCKSCAWLVDLAFA